MSNIRDTGLIKLRPSIDVITHSDDDKLLKFQQVTLRPILKLQHPVLQLFATDFLSKSNKGFYSLNLSDQVNILQQTIKGNITFKKLLTGIIIGQFTVEEMEIYLNHQEEINKRITEFLFKRISSAL